ncbi:hypothetical protein KM043_007894 [Ampulex compressa]|nr:hypothetical protein KM043_007894 [Ampulex compressa]
MFAVIGHRLEHAFNNVEKLSRKERESVFCASLARTVRYQCSLIEYLNIAMDCYVISYTVQFIIAAIDITGVLLNVQIALTSPEKTDLLLLYLVDVFSHYFILFLNIFPFQKMTNCSVHIFRDAYQGRWYEAPVRPKKLLLFIMKRNLEPFVVNVAGVLTLSNETFASIVYTATSYFMVLYTVQEKYNAED